MADEPLFDPEPSIRDLIYERVCNVAEHYKDGDLTEADMRYSMASILRDHEGSKL